MHPRFFQACVGMAKYFSPLLERRCAACATPVPVGEQPAQRPVFCASCAANLARRVGGYCSRCGNLTALTESVPAPCGDCLTNERPWGKLFFHAEYCGLLRDLILRFKSGRELPLANLLGCLLANHPGITGPYDALVPLPLHSARLRERGFNQAVELAKPLAERLVTPIMYRALGRMVHTRPQAGLTLVARRDNVRGVFSATGDVAGKRLLLVDDIATTCATLENAATVLRKAGAASVDVAVVARTPEYSTVGRDW